MFVDADMVLEPGNFKRSILDGFSKAETGMIGGYILNKKRQPMAWNYGFEMHPKKDAWFWQVYTTLNRQDLSDVHRNELIKQLREVGTDYHWVYPEALKLKARKVDWVAEGLFAIRAELFKAVGGYDENMRYHEGQDLARIIRSKDFDIVFDPSFSSTHQELEVRDGRRDEDFLEGQFYFFSKHWGMSREVFDRIYS